MSYNIPRAGWPSVIVSKLILSFTICTVTLVVTAEGGRGPTVGAPSLVILCSAWLLFSVVIERVFL